VQDGRPHVILKLAVSADGKAARSGRRPAAITGEAGRARAHLLRSQSDAVLTGIGTVVADDPLLTSRLPGMRSPLRVVLDATLRLPLASKLVATARQVSTRPRCFARRRSSGRTASMPSTDCRFPH